MTMQDINDQLHRPLMSGKQYDRYFPNSACSISNLATGDTAVAIKEMAKWSVKYAHHCADIAPVLKSSTLENTVNKIQDFLYNHIQYSIDGEDQNLKSPACAWATRDVGTDCKSYTIFGSAILLQLGVKHYLRRIKQAVMSDYFTHVYVVIPVNQTTGKLTDGYYTIDGTIKYNTELPFSEKDDIYMEPKLAINGLAAGLSCGHDVTCGCADNNDITIIGAGVGAMNADFSIDNQITPAAIEGFYYFMELLSDEGVDEELLSQAIKNMNAYIEMGIEPTVEQVFTIHYNSGLGAIKAPTKKTLDTLKTITSIVGDLFKSGGFFSNIFGSIDCIGGSAFGGGDLKKALNEQQAFVVNQVEKINKAVYSGDLNRLAEECMLFIAANEETHKGMQEKLTQGWNSCTTKNLKTFIENLEFFNNYGNKALLAWLNQYFTIQYGSNRNYSFKSIPISSYASSHMNYHNQVYVQRTMTLDLKKSTRDIPGFELNEILIKQGENKNFNQSSFLQSLQEVIAIVDGPSNPPNSSNNGGNNDYYSDFESDKKDRSQAGGIGMIILAGVAVGAIVYSSKKRPKNDK